MAFTFTTLKTAIQDYTQNSETTFVNNLSRFIINAEERIFKEVQLDVFRKNVNGDLTSGNKFLTKPTDYLSTFSLSIINSSENVFLLRKHPTFLQDYTPNPSTTGVPQYYADFDETTFIVAPTPSSALTAELHYYHKPTSITATSDGTSWLGTNAELALLYASLVEAYTFMKGEPDVMQNYAQRFTEAVQSLKLYGEAKEVSDYYRTGMVMRDKQ